MNEARNYTYEIKRSHDGIYRAFFYQKNDLGFQGLHSVLTEEQLEKRIHGLQELGVLTKPRKR